MKLKKVFIETFKRIHEREKIPQLFVLVSFVVTYGIVRAITHLQKAHLLPNQNGPLHIHHMVPGIILLLITGYISISYWTSERVRVITSIFFGIGAALTMDEFALWLFLQNVYWAKQGRDSVDAVIITIVLLTIAVLVTNNGRSNSKSTPLKKPRLSKSH